MNKNEQPRRKPRTRGDAQATQAETQRKSRRANRHNAQPASWGNVDSETLLRAVCAVAELGCAIQLGYTKDGGAFSIRVVGDGKPYNEFVRPTEDINLHLEGMYEDFRK